MAKPAGETGQITATAAAIYDELYVPALFQEWAPRLVAAAQVEPGQRVLDVACGTGVLTRALLARVGTAGDVTGLDLNDGMLSVARSRAAMPAARMSWCEAPAEQLPFDDASFDAVLCQFGLMFFRDRKRALAEMWRVLRPSGRLAIAVWDSLERTPAYSRVAALLERLFGGGAAAGMRSPYALGDVATLRALFASAGIHAVEFSTHTSIARFPSLERWVFADAKGWTAADLIDDAGLARLLSEAQHELREFVTADGSVAFETPAHIATARRAPGPRDLIRKRASSLGASQF